MCVYIYVLSHWLLLTLRCVISCSVERVEEGGGRWTQDGRTQPFSRVSGAYPAILSVMCYPFIFRADGDTSIVPTPSHRHAIFCVRWSLSPAALHCQKKGKENTQKEISIVSHFLAVRSGQKFKFICLYN